MLTRRFGALLAPFLFLTVLLTVLPGCLKAGLPGGSGTDTAGSPYPRLVLRVGEQEVPAVLGPALPVLSQPWPVPLPRQALVEHLAALTMSLEGVKVKPERIEISIRPRFELEAATPPAGKALVEFTVDPATIRREKNGFRWETTLPAIPQTTRGEAEVYGLVVSIDPAGDEEPALTYYGMIQVVAPGVAGRVIEAVRDVWAATFGHERERAEQLIRGQPVIDRELYRPPTEYGFAWAAEYSPWDMILWESDRYQFRALEDPAITVHSFGPGPSGPYAEAQARFEVLVTEKRTGSRVRWSMTETYNLEWTPDGWKVRQYRRFGVPWFRSGGTEPGWAVEASRLSGLVRAGPFPGINQYQGMARNPRDGSLAFVADNFGTTEVWIVDPAGPALQRLTAVPQSRDGGNNQQQFVYVLGWNACGNALRFLVAGYQTAGPRQGLSGFWVGNAAYPAGTVTEIAWIPARADWPKDNVVTADGRHLFLRLTPDLWRVDLESGEVAHLKDDLPSYDGLFGMYWHPSGTMAAWNLWEGEGKVVVLDPVAGSEFAFVPGPGDPPRAYFAGWAGDAGDPAESGDGPLAAVSFSQPEDIVPGEDFNWPAGYRVLRFYNRTGKLVHEIRPPRDAIGRAWAWVPAGGAVAFVTGPIVNLGIDPWSGYPIIVTKAKDLWLWESKTGKARHLARLAGPVDQLEWLPDGAGIAVWYSTRKPDESGGQTRSGLLVTLAGKTSPLEQYMPGDPQAERVVGRVDGVSYLVRTAPSPTGGGPRIARLIRLQGGQEEVLEQGPYRYTVSEQSGLGTVLIREDAVGSGFSPGKSYLYMAIDPQ